MFDSYDGGTRVNVTVAPYDDILFYFVKPCVIPKLNIGSSPGVADIMMNTTLAPNITLSSPTLEKDSTYYMWLNPDIPTTLNFVLLPIQSDNTVSVGVQALTEPETLNNTFPNGIKLRWNCLTSKAATTSVRVTIDIHFQDLYEFNVTKTCPDKPADGPNGGWSTTGIFFFCVFLIIVVFCVAGCGYNFVKNEKTGFDVVPGATYYRSCYEKIFAPKRYTPQMDNYDTTTGGASSGGKSYGSTSYQDQL
jgi:hypothetical protein